MSHVGLAIGGDMDGKQIRSDGPYYRAIKRMKTLDLSRVWALDDAISDSVVMNTITYEFVPYNYFEPGQGYGSNRDKLGFWIMREDWDGRIPSFNEVLRYLVDWYVMKQKD